MFRLGFVELFFGLGEAGGPERRFLGGDAGFFDGFETVGHRGGGFAADNDAFGVDEVSVVERWKICVSRKELLWMVKGGNSPLDEVRPLFTRPPPQLFIFPHLIERGPNL